PSSLLTAGHTRPTHTCLTWGKKNSTPKWRKPACIFTIFRPASTTGASDESKVRLAGFRDWLRDKYGNKRTLRQAWKDNEVDFRTATPADISGTDKEKSWRKAGDRRYFDT